MKCESCGAVGDRAVVTFDLGTSIVKRSMCAGCIGIGYQRLLDELPEARRRDELGMFVVEDLKR